MSAFIFFLIALAMLRFITSRSLRLLQYFQQEEYNGKRFFHWLVKNSAFDSRASLLILAILIITFALSQPYLAPLNIAGALLIFGLSYFEADPRKHGKLPLKLTSRALRIWYAAVLLYFCVIIIIVLIFDALSLPFTLFWALQLVLIQLVPVALISANSLLAPYENYAQRIFINEAKLTLKKCRPKIIGVTGSYGKTSTKALVARFLETHSPTFWPSGGINTEMGIVREIREKLIPGFRYAVIEMGAYGIGSIEKLCSLTPPQIAVITNIGVMHLERFGSPEAIYRAKSELARALPADGVLICNGDNAGARKVSEEFRAIQTYLYGIETEDVDFHMTDIRSSASGSTFKIRWKDNMYEGSSKLLGTPQLSNLLAAFCVACIEGANPLAVLAVAARIRPQKHRMELKKRGDWLMIDDSYNSNPLGFSSALHVLQSLPGAKKIVVTPGMIELGPIQESENRRLAALAGEICDEIVVIGETNRSSLSDGFQSKSKDNAKVIVVDNRREAITYLEDNVQSGDVVLWENDLPDLYETKPSF